MNSMLCQGIIHNQDSSKIDLEMLINKVPIVYTTKLDDMWIFQRKIKNIPKGDLVDIILCESLPVFNSFPNRNPEEKDITKFNDLKLKLSKLFYKKSKKTVLNTKNTKLKRRKQSKTNSKDKNNVAKPDSESQFDPCIESESLVNINIVIIDCNGVQTVSTLRDLKDALKDVELTISDRTFNKHDVYVIDTDGCISEHHRDIKNDVKLNRNYNNKMKIVMDFCCWVQRNKGVNSMYPRYVSLPTLEYMLESHKCLPNRCVCCCREGDVDEIRTSNEASVISKSKDVVLSQDAENYFLHMDWLADLKADEKSSSNLIDRALCYNGTPTIKTNIECQTKKNVLHWKRDAKVKCTKHGKEHKIIYEFGSKSGSLISLNRILLARYNKMYPKPLYLKRIKQSKRYSGCCWYDYNRMEQTLIREELNNIAKYYIRPHLCPIDYCACCCKNYCNDTNLTSTVPRKIKRSSSTSSSTLTASSASSTHYEKIDFDMTVTLLTKRSKHVWEKFANLRIIVTYEGKVSARVPPVSSLSTEEVKALSKILASAEEEVQRQSLQPGTCIRVRMNDQNEDCIKIELESVNDNDGIKNVSDDDGIQEQKSEPIDIEEHSIFPRVFESAKDDNNFNEFQIEASRKKSYYDTDAEQVDIESKKEITNMQDRGSSPTMKLEAILQDNIYKESQITTRNDDFTVAQLHASDLKNEPIDIQQQVISPQIVFVKSEINDQHNIENLNSVTEPKDDSQHQASETKNNLTDMQEQVVLPPVVFKGVIEDNNDIQNVIHNIQESENDPPVAEHRAAEATISNVKLDRSERISKVIDGLPIDTNNITYVIQQPSTDPVLIPLRNIAPNENLDCQIGLPRIEKIYSIQSVDDLTLNPNNNNYVNIENGSEFVWHLPTCESTQFTSVNSNDNQEVDNMKSAPKRKSDAQSNVPPKIRVVSPSKLGFVYGTNNKECNESTSVHHHKQNASAIDTTNNTKVKVTSEPNKSRQIQNKKIGEAPKYVKILPKPPNLPNKNSGSVPSAPLLKPTNLSKANHGSEPPVSLSKPKPSASWLNMGKSVSLPTHSKKTSNRKIKKKIVKIIFLKPSECSETAPYFCFTVNSNDSIKETDKSNGTVLEELTTMQICDVLPPQLSTLNSNDDKVNASELRTVNRYEVASQLSSLNSINIDDKDEVTAPELRTVNSYDVASQLSSLNTIIINDNDEATASELRTVNSYEVASQLSSLKSINIDDDDEVTAPELRTVNSSNVTSQLSSVNTINIDDNDKATATELRTVNSFDVASQLSSLNSIIIDNDDEVTDPELRTVNSYDVASQSSSLNTIIIDDNDEESASELKTVDKNSKVTAPKFSTANSCDLAQLSRVNNNYIEATAPNVKTMNKTHIIKSKRPIILKRRNKYIVKY